MNAPHTGVSSVQSKTAPTTINEDVIRVGYAPDRTNSQDVLGRKAGYVVAPEDRLPIVTEWSGMDDFKNAPPDYATFFVQYQNYTRVLLSRYGVFAADLEDMSMDMMTRFMERDSIGVYTPNWGSQSESGKSYFRSYYSQFIATYVAGYKRNYAKYRTRHALIMDAEVDEGTTWYDLHAPTYEDNLESVEFAQVIEAVRASESVSDEVLDAVLSLASLGPVRQVALREALGCSAKDAKGALDSVRRALSDCLPG